MAGRILTRDSGDSSEAATYSIAMEESRRTVPLLSHRSLRLRCSYPGCLKHALLTNPNP